MDNSLTGSLGFEGIELAMRMTELCRKDVLPALRGEDYLPLTPPTKLASIGPILDGAIASTQKKVRRGEHLKQSTKDWWRRWQWWRGHVQAVEEKSASRLSALLMYLRYAIDCKDEEVATELRGYLADKWNWTGEPPKDRKTADEQARRLCRRVDIMSNALFYGPR